MSDVTCYVGNASKIGIANLELGNPLMLIYGTFHLHYYGHVHLLTRPHSLGLLVAVGLPTDKFNFRKNKLIVLNYKEGSDLLLQLVRVGLVFSVGLWKQKRNDKAKLDAWFLMMGSNWCKEFYESNSSINAWHLDRKPEISNIGVREIGKIQQGNNPKEMQNYFMTRLTYFSRRC